MQKTATSPTDYLKSLPEETRADMMKLDREIAKAMKGLSRTLWEGVFWGGSEQSIIGYGDFTYAGARKKPVEWFMVGLALQKNYISLYVNAVEGNKYLAEKYKSELGKVKVGKSSISFRKLDEVNLDTLLELVSRAREMLTADQLKARA